MIDTITFAAGPTPGGPRLEVALTPMTILVGPNHSGKSLALRELEGLFAAAQVKEGVVIHQITMTPRNAEELRRQIDGATMPNMLGERLGNSVRLGKIRNNSLFAQILSRDEILAGAAHAVPGEQNGQYRIFLGLFLVRLDGQSRLSLLQQQPAGDMQRPAENLLARLFRNNHLRSGIRSTIADAIGRFLVVDPTSMGTLRVRLADVAPVDEAIERGWTEASIAFHAAALPIEEASDGLKAFVGTIVALQATDVLISLIDEPEAFLHPGLASKLGKAIGRSVAKSNRRVFASTHSAHFLMGCVQSGTPINIVRTTYHSGVATARLLPQTKLLALMKHPLLRSTGVLNALFYDSVVVTESDTDRAFYQEINERLLDANDTRGVRNCLFLNAQNKQTVWDIVKPLREMGIPTAGVVDIDVLKEGGTVWSKPMDGAFVPEISQVGFQVQRKALLDAFTKTGKDMKRDGGTSLLGDADREAARSFIDSLAKYGIYVVPGGELESWLPALGATGHGTAWLVDMFTRMGSEEGLSYVRPFQGDVWDFMGTMRDWFETPNRSGIPDGN